MRILLDHTDCDWSAMPLADVEQRASLLIRMAAEIGRQRCAFVVGDASSYGVARLLALLLDAQVDFRARAFTSIEEARTWLCETQAVGENHVVPAGS